MKTFMGNPLEQTPKSAHTDHTIRGYTYEVIVSKGEEKIGEVKRTPKFGQKNGRK
jgi:hypothetical protein